MIFHNIFSKNQDKPPEKKPATTIIIDTREKQSLVASYLSQKVNINFEHLYIADYLIKDIAIERKTFSDFISSIINKRLFSQIKEIKKYSRYFLVLEGERKYENKNLEKAAKSMILSCILDCQVPIIFTENEKETAEFLLVLANKLEKQKTEISIRPSKTLLTKQQQVQYILEGFPGIGPKTAKKLLKKFGSIKKIINTNIEQLEEIIGKKAEIFKIVDV